MLRSQCSRSIWRINCWRAITFIETCHANYHQLPSIFWSYRSCISFNKNWKKILTLNGSFDNSYWNNNCCDWIYEWIFKLDIVWFNIFHGLFRVNIRTSCLDLFAISCTTKNIIICNCSELGNMLFSNAFIPNNKKTITRRKPILFIFVLFNLEYVIIFYK